MGEDKYNPMGWARGGFEMNMPSMNEAQNVGTTVKSVLETSHPLAAKQAATAAAGTQPKRTPVEFPPHLFIPEGAESIDMRRVIDCDPATTNQLLIDFTAPQGAVTKFIGYAVYNDGLLFQNYEFLPEIDSMRILRYHGNPAFNFKIGLGLAPDLSNISIIPCQISMMPNQRLTWKITNTSAVVTKMGVRMIGYFDTQQKTTTTKFG